MNYYITKLESRESKLLVKQVQQWSSTPFLKKVVYTIYLGPFWAFTFVHVGNYDYVRWKLKLVYVYIYIYMCTYRDLYFTRILTALVYLYLITNMLKYITAFITSKSFLIVNEMTVRDTSSRWSEPGDRYFIIAINSLVKPCPNNLEKVSRHSQQ